MAIDFSDKILIIHPTAFYLGRCVLVLGLLIIAVGAITAYTGPFLLPAMGWFAVAVPTMAVGGILVGCSITKP